MPDNPSIDRAATLDGTREPFEPHRAIPFLFGLAILFVPWPLRIAGLLAARMLADSQTNRRYAHVVSVWLDGEMVPVVEHRFVGKTPEDAVAR